MPEEVDRELRFACADQETTKSRLVRNLIEEYLESWRIHFEAYGNNEEKKDND
ncbi:MAG: hypothetical protein U9N81_05520 [Bacillota bacterium]|nr:hypothetical protein [Bacillota bacterium]